MKIETKIYINDLINKDPSWTTAYRKNLIKQYLQTLVLDFIYSHKEYNRLVFYGGTCLAFCFDFQRLSEDLDFVDLKKKIDLKKLAFDLKTYFTKKTDLSLAITAQKFRLYLKFPILKELNLAKKMESDHLFVKIEVFSQFDYCRKYQLTVRPIYKYDRSILVRTFDLATMFSTKILAILHRSWQKTDKKGRTLIRVKGRDYFDLLWYLQKNIQPNMTCLKDFKSIEKLKKALLAKVSNVDSQSIQLDLEGLVKDSAFAANLSRHLKGILLREIQEKL